MLRQLKFALRLYRKQPIFSLALTFTLALGIGATTTVYTALDSVLLKPFPYHDVNSLFIVREADKAALDESTSDANFVDWRRAATAVFADMAAYVSSSPIVTIAGQPERVSAAVVTPNFFSVLGTQPALGHSFPEGASPGDRVLIVSHRFWRTRLGSVSEIDGASLIVDEHLYQVVGVMPESFLHPGAGSGAQVDIWLPLAIDPKPERRRSDYLTVIARKLPNVSLAQVKSQMSRLTLEMQRLYPSADGDYVIRTIPLKQELLGPIRPTIVLVFCTAAVLLGISCVNVASLLIARANQRHAEFSVRAALGASPLALFRQLVVESVTLGLMGGIGGLVFAVWGVRALYPLAGTLMPRVVSSGLALDVFFFVAGTSILAGALFGLAPAYHAFRSCFSGGLSSGAQRTTAGVARSRFNFFVITAEVALALLMVITALDLLQSLFHMQQVDLGIQPGRVLTASIALPFSKYPNDGRAHAFFEKLTSALARTPGVEDTAVTSALPGGGATDTFTLHIAGGPSSDSPLPDVRDIHVSPGYFSTMSIPLLRGRGFGEMDDPDSLPVTIVGETFAQRFWRGQDPLGKRIAVGVPKPGPRDWRTVIGVVKDVRYGGITQNPGLQLYTPEAQVPNASMYLVLRLNANPSGFADIIRRRVWAADPHQAVSDIRSMNSFLSESIIRPKLTALLVTLFGATALLLASAGVYAVLSQAMSQRKKAMSIRISLGARPSAIISLALKDGLQPVVIGLAAGFVAAIGADRLIRSLTFGLTSSNLFTLAGASFLLLSCCALACFVPALRYSRLDPTRALREQ